MHTETIPQKENACVICSIVAGTDKSVIVYEDKQFIAFLDKRPLFLGHCLLAPKKHIVGLHDLPNNKIKSYFFLVQQLSKAVESSMQAKGSFIAINNVVSQSIPHLHTHIVPRNPHDGLKGFFWPRMHYENEEQMASVQMNIHHALLDLLG